MANQLKVKKESLESEVAFDWNGSSYKVLLKNASPAQLEIIHKLGVPVFEEPEKKDK